eukprot:TRINITY_DN807_c0_g1_i1.p1 TRINITY_DN807_c0_g1~~TRINITY_DN807_c0_g1_i1.p1  ORF type:complete len:299 (-),score=39.70 TRINITY_DN807_c0_g1_i1:242-1138(-)
MSAEAAALLKQATDGLASPSQSAFTETRRLLQILRSTGQTAPRIVLEVGENFLNLPPTLDFSSDSLWDMYEQVFVAGLQCGELNVAKGCLARLRKQFSNSLRVSRLYGLLFEARGEYDKATALYRNNIQNCPTDQFSYRRQVVVARAKGGIRAAIEALNQYLGVFMNDVEAWGELADMYVDAQLYENACFCFEEVIISSTQNYHNFTRYAELLYTLKDYAAALKNFSFSVELSRENNLRSYFGICLCLSSMKQKNGLSTLEKEAFTLAKDRLLSIYQGEGTDMEPYVRDALRLLESES